MGKSFDPVSLAVAKAAAGGGGGSGSDVFVVHFTDTDEDTVSDKSFEEIVEASNSGKVIFGEYDSEVYSLSNVQADGEPSDRVIFSNIALFEGYMYHQLLSIRPGSYVIEATQETYEMTPAV